MEKSYKAFIFLIGAAACMGIGAGGMYLRYKDAIEVGKEYPLIAETYNFMKDSEKGLPENPDDSAQINSFLALYDDKYTFFSPNNTDSMEHAVADLNSSPTANGCGFEVDIDTNGRIYFSEVDETLYAYEQGIRQGDILLSINGAAIEKPIDLKEIKGKAGTTVELGLERDGKQQSLTLTRYSDSDSALGVSIELQGDVLYVRYESLTVVALAPYLEEYEGKYSSIILDIRDNPGGEIANAINTADPFIGEADVNLNYYNGAVTTYSTDEEITIDVPIVLLVNEHTASSAEILTALLKQYADTTIVGENTLGKGIFQGYGTFHGGIVQQTLGTVTVGEWECYQGVGIAPDVEVKMDSELIGTDDDIQLQKAFELLS